jgi:hypothetical protein
MIVEILANHSSQLKRRPATSVEEYIPQNISAYAWLKAKHVGNVAS